MSRSLAFLIEYDGTDFAGWQFQPNGVSVQEVLERAVEECFGVVVPVVGSGRTDSGVHARGQVAHVHVLDGANTIPTEKVALALNRRLPRSVRIRKVVDVPADFHARFSARSREYVYVITDTPSVFDMRYAWTPSIPFDRGLLGNAARIFVGKHDFTTFSKLNADTASYVCDVETCRVETLSDRLLIRIRADRFVYGMCRAIVGVMFDV
ncbi:MAG TPA: tRNA pseudouridine(38-40) synthase TruA, partial [Bacteroidetes bacterium]|nr:tRNA pseudouridine(38-40) synthase TruA [Bacteroidota bacterium]